jgi:D-cysteine desulfhydrase
VTGEAVTPLALAHLPTPLQRPTRLCEELGIELWVKRDDATGGPEAGNKIRKLGYLLADALAQGCDTVITCGGVQSNHARATAVLCAQLGLSSRLLLRATELEDDDGGRGVAPTEELAPSIGNVLIDRLVGADIRLITRASYQRRAAVMQRAADDIAADGGKPYIIAEGGSNGLGALGYVDAMAETRMQLDEGAANGKAFDVIVHACGSGGTSAGIALGAKHHRVADELLAVAVCDDVAYFEERIESIMSEARALRPQLSQPARLRVVDRFKGPAYGVSTEPQRACMVEAARLSGLVLDPVYTGKAFHGLWQMSRDELAGKRVLFIHTGGLPGLLAEASSILPQL